MVPTGSGYAGDYRQWRYNLAVKRYFNPGDHVGYEPPFKITPAIQNLCIRIGELVGGIDPGTGLATNPRLHRELRIRTVHSSLSIEGNSLTEDQVEAVLNGKRVFGSRNDILEVENANRAYDLLDELNPYSVDSLLKAHHVMMHGLTEGAGVFRSKNVGVYDGTRLIHAGTPAAYVSQVIGELFAWLPRSSWHPLITSAIFHYEFEFIHPFSDGNGRVGRLWHTLLLTQWRPVLAWLPIESAICRRQQDYYQAINAANTLGSSEPFVLFMLEAVEEALVPFSHVGTDGAAQRARVLEFFTNNPTGTVSLLATELGISKRSAERMVANLKAEGVLVRQGTPRAGRWLIP